MEKVLDINSYVCMKSAKTWEIVIVVYPIYLCPTWCGSPISKENSIRANAWTSLRSAFPPYEQVK